MTVNLGEAAGPRHAASPSRPPSLRPRPSRRSIRLGRLDMKISPYLFVAPFFVLFAAIGVYPLVWTAYISLHKYTLSGVDEGNVGFTNYRRLLTDDHFWTAIYNTFGLFIVATVPQLLLALLLASWLNKRLRARTGVRMGVLVPNITSVATVGIVFGFIFADRYGLINWLIHTVGFNPIDWRDHRWSSWTAISVMVDWRWTGYNALIYLAAMQAIPRDLYESAAIDGAGAFRRFWRITVPLIQPTILFTVIISTIGGMQLFTEPLLFNYGRYNGGSLNEFQTAAMYLYETTFVNQSVGRGAAISWLLFMVIIIFAVINFALVRRSVKGNF
jgi:cellobiose transport system permease protein